jgi:hypothetical protein
MRDDLEEAVERDQPGNVLGRALCKLVPYKYHRDTAVIPMNRRPRKNPGRAGRPSMSPLKKITASPNISVGPINQS